MVESLTECHPGQSWPACPSSVFEHLGQLIRSKIYDGGRTGTWLSGLSPSPVGSTDLDSRPFLFLAAAGAV